MDTFGNIIRKAREEKGLFLRQVAAVLEIDQALISKFERGDRKPSKEQVEKFADFYGLDRDELIIVWLSDKIVYTIQGEKNAEKVLKVAEEKIEYLSKTKLSRSEIIKKIKKYFIRDKKILKAWLFGSFARGEDDYKSDIDLMIQVADNSRFSLFDLAEIQYQLEKSIPYKIDVIMKGGIKPQVMDRIKSDLKLIYER